MSKFPLLEQMRAERDRREDIIAKPLKDEIMRGAAMVRDLRKALRAVEEMLGSEIAAYAKEEIAHMLSRELRQKIMKALAGAGQQPGSPVTMTLPIDTLRFMDPKSIEREVLNRYIDGLPRLNLRADVRPTDRVTIMDIRIPELGYRRALVG